MSTNALMEEQADSNEMPLKYGPPTLIRHSAIKSGESVQKRLEWSLPGLHVEYNVALPGESEGQVANVNQGRIRVETWAAYERRLAKEKEKVKPKM
jgi:hypothetical protein